MSHNSAVVFVPQQNDQTQNGSAKSELSLSPGVSSTAGKGKGKVVPRKGFRSQAVILAKIPLYSARDIENGECDDYPKPRFLARLKAEWVPITALDHTSQTQHAYALFRAGSPVKLTGTPLVVQLRKNWNLQHLTDGMAQDHKWNVLCSSQTHNCFTSTDMDKNTFGSYYHIREPQTRNLQMSFKEYAQCAKHWTINKVLFKNTIMQYPEQQAYDQVPHPVPCLAAALVQELQTRISWDWLQALQKLVRFGPTATVSLQAGSRDSLLPAQYHTHERLLAQVKGCQRILLIPPEHAFRGMYPYPLHHPYDSYSMVDLEQPDLGQWPSNATVRGLCCIVKPGDVLYLPAYWFVHAQCLEQENISLNVHMSMGLRAHPPACIPLQLSRHLEGRVAELEGVADVRHWLRLIGFCEEQDWIDLSTTKGYCRVVMCQEVRDELEGNLTKPHSAEEEEQDSDEQDEWQRVLIAMCDGRLLPTPWLNKDFREPLYLTDHATQIKDERPEEERKYPQLFRRKLTGKGWSLPDL